MQLRNITIDALLGGQRYKAGVRDTRELGAMKDRKGWEIPELKH